MVFYRLSRREGRGREVAVFKVCIVTTRHFDHFAVSYYLVIILLNLIYIYGIKWSLKIDSEEIAGSRKNYIARILV